MNTCILGLDPGAGGGIAIYRAGEMVAHKMPTTDRDLFDLIAGQTPETVCVAFMENVHSSPQMGVVSAFKFGRGVGALQMALTAAFVRIELVSPQKWQREFGLIVKGRGLGQDDVSKKNRNKQRAQDLWPHLRITHAIADCLLICEFGRRQLSQRGLVA